MLTRTQSPPRIITILFLTALAVLSVASCTSRESTRPSRPTPADTYEILDVSETDSTASDTRLDVPPASVPHMVIGTWNLHNFSRYGDSEYRIDDIADEIRTLASDILAVQELKVKEDTNGSPPQAWDALLDLLPEYSGVHAPWDLGNDTTVGLLYRSDVVTLEDWTVIYEDDWYAFPRPPLVATVTVARDGMSVTFNVVSLHLKAMRDSADRRADACFKLDQYVQSSSEQNFLLIGDLNDDPHDEIGDNVFLGVFLDDPDYVFITAVLPPESVTSTGYYHMVNGRRIQGEFLDHGIATTHLANQYRSVTPAIFGVPESEFDDYRSQVSDHFPVMITFEP